MHTIMVILTSRVLYKYLCKDTYNKHGLIVEIWMILEYAN